MSAAVITGCPREIAAHQVEVELMRAVYGFWRPVVLLHNTGFRKGWIRDKNFGAVFQCLWDRISRLDTHLSDRIADNGNLLRLSSPGEVLMSKVRHRLVETRPLAIMSPMEDAALIHIIDDDPSMRAALDSLLRSVNFVTRMHESVAAFLANDRPDSPGCLILDVRLPGMSGLDFQSQLRRFKVQLPVILMTGHGDIPMSVRGMKAGAVDFLTKPFRDQDMIDAVNVAVERDRVQRTIATAAVALQTRFATLSARERQVMQLVVAGRMNKQIAADLHVSEITVKLHRGAAMRKMGARTLADLVRMSEALGHSRPSEGP